MVTKYKSRAWWTLRALEYGASESAHPTTGAEQNRIWCAEGAKAMAAAFAPTGDDRLRVLYPDGAPEGTYDYPEHQPERDYRPKWEKDMERVHA
jgi:hypothetical protein